jgi:hypothetical protein
MPFFKSTYNILQTPWEDEVFDPKWMESDKLILPKFKKWDYNKELHIEDVNIWEVLFESGGGIGVYAAWDPFAEFYMLTYKPVWHQPKIEIETYYGQGAQQRIQKRIKELGFPIPLKEVWVEDEDMWLYQTYETQKIIT